ncbi:MAG TPA: DUF4097 family beta strand repeat-containing protein [Terriglobia bacterium]|jgi:hypothetical protein|nr:DUF4097 family beta strand repeat-containing protein [Terriglobia bacterium]
MRAVIASLCLSIAATATAQALERQQMISRYPLVSGGRVSIENVQGGIEVEGWDRSEVQVAVTKTARGSGGQLDDVRIIVEAAGRSLTLYTLYPESSREPVQVDYRLRVPRQVNLDGLRTVYGSVKVRDIEGPADLRTLNGNIELENVTGRIKASAVSGSIAASLRALPDSASALDLESLNGDLYLLLPARANADLELSTVAGEIRSKYAWQVNEVAGDTTRRTRLGKGGPVVKLRTVRGDIRVDEMEDVL